jgi:hypothetical protein
MDFATVISTVIFACGTVGVLSAVESLYCRI